MNFSHYQVGDFYDEMFTAEGVPRPLARRLLHTIETMPEGELLKPMPPQPNRRRTDYLILFGLLNGFIGLLIYHGMPWDNPFLLGLFIMGNLSLAWVLFGVMDRY